jgi:hypothetical protein
MLMILGPIGLAIAILTSLWSSSRQIERSVNVQAETRWVAGEQLAIRTQIVGGDLAPLDVPTRVSLRYLDADGGGHELGELTEVGPGLVQGVFEVPELEPGGGELELHYVPARADLEPFSERVPVEIVAERGAADGHQVVSEHMLQWADDTDEQPEGVRIDLRPAGRLLAGFDNRLFVRVTDPAGKPWRPPPAKLPTGEGPKEGEPEATPSPAKPEGQDPEAAPAPAKPEPEIQVVLVSGEFDEQIGDADKPPVLYEGPLDALGLASFHGLLSSDTVRFEVRLRGKQASSKPEPGTKPEPSPGLAGPKRKLRFVSHAGTVRVHASTDFAHPGDTLTITVDALSARRPAFVDVHGPAGAWLDTFTPPLVVPQEREWIVPEQILASAGAEAGPFVQFEAYQSTLRPEDSSAIARVQLAPAGSERSDALAPLIERQREQLSLPRVDREFEIGRERAFLSHLEAQHRAGALSAEEIERARAFLIGSLEAVVHGPPQALNTRAREEQTLAAFKREWTVGIRWFLLGGGALFILVMATMIWRNQRRIEAQTSDALGLAAGPPGEPGPGPNDEALADQSLAIMQARRQILARGVLTIALMVAALLLTVAMLESLVWEY